MFDNFPSDVVSLGLGLQKAFDNIRVHNIGGRFLSWSKNIKWEHIQIASMKLVE